jgi:hypothetical protein
VQACSAAVSKVICPYAGSVVSTMRASMSCGLYGYVGYPGSFGASCWREKAWRIRVYFVKYLLTLRQITYHRSL